MKGSARGEQRRREIVDCALELAVERGFADLTLDEVARVAGASKSTLMRFFGGRAGLIEATLEREMEFVFSPLEGAADDLDRFGAAFQAVVFSSRCAALLRFVLGTSASDPTVGTVFRTVVLGRLRSLLTPAMSAALNQPEDSERMVEAVDQYLGDLLGLELLTVLSGAEPDEGRLTRQRHRAAAAVRPRSADEPVAEEQPEVRADVEVSSK